MLSCRNINSHSQNLKKIIFVEARVHPGHRADRLIEFLVGVLGDDDGRLNFEELKVGIGRRSICNQYKLTDNPNRKTRKMNYVELLLLFP